MSLSGHNNPAIRPLSSMHVRHARSWHIYYHHLFFPCLEMQAVWRKNGPIIVELSGTLCHHIAFMTDHDTSLFLFCLLFGPTVSLCIKFWFDLSIPTSMFFSLAFVFPWLKSICKVFCITSGNSSQSSVPQASSYNFRVGLQGNGKVDLHLRSCNKLPLNAIFAISNAFLWL